MPAEWSPALPHHDFKYRHLAIYHYFLNRTSTSGITTCFSLAHTPPASICDTHTSRIQTQLHIQLVSPPHRPPTETIKEPAERCLASPRDFKYHLVPAHGAFCLNSKCQQLLARSHTSSTRTDPHYEGTQQHTQPSTPHRPTATIATITTEPAERAPASPRDCKC